MQAANQKQQRKPREKKRKGPRSGWQPKKSETKAIAPKMRGLPLSTTPKANGTMKIWKESKSLARGNSTMERLIMSISLPAISDSVRGPPCISNMPTTIVNPYVEYTVSFPASASVDPDANQHFVAISKNPLLGIVYSHQKVVPYNYDFQFRSMVNQAPPKIVPYCRIPIACIGTSTVGVTSVQNIEPVYATYNPSGPTAVAVAGSTMYTFKTYGKTYFMTHCETTYLRPKFYNSTVNGPGTELFPLPTGFTIQMRLYYVSGDNNETTYWEGNIGDNNQTIQLALLGFFRVEILIVSPSNNALPSVDMTMAIGNATTADDQTQLYSSPHHGFNTAGPGWDFANARINSASICVSNTTPVINRGGSIAGISLPNRSSFFSFLAGDNYYNQVTRAPRAVTLPLETGMYGFHRPTSLPEAELAPLVARDTNTFVPIGFDSPLFPPGGWVVCAFDRVVNEPLDLVYRVSYAAEGVPYSNFYQVQSSYTTSSDWLLLCDIMSNSTQFVENPIHIKALIAAAKKAASSVVRNGPEVLRLLSTVFPGLRIPALVAEGAALAARHV